MKKIILISISILYIFFAQAQSDSLTLNEAVISATRTVQPIQKTAQQVGILKAKDIQFLNVPTAAHALEQTGQVLVQRSQGGGGSPMLRGFEANKVLLVVDGIRLNNAIYRGGHLQNVITLDPNALDKIEVLFGSNSLMYGSDALGGVMYFQTKRPQLSTSDNLNLNGNAMVRYGSAANEKSTNLTFNLGLERFASLTSVSFSDFGDLKTGKNFDSKYGNWGKRTFYVDRINGKDSIVNNKNAYVQKGTAYNQFDVLQKFLFKQNEHINHILNIQFSNSSNIPRYDRLTEVDSKGVPKQAEWYYGPQKRLLTAYQFEHNKNTLLSDKISLSAAYQNIEESRYTRSFGKSNRTARIENVNIMSLNVDVLKNVSQNQLHYGVEMQYNDVASTAEATNINTGAVTPASTRYPDGGSKMAAYAAYLTANRNLNSIMNIFGGLRYNYTTLNATINDKTFYALPFNSINQKYGALVGNIGTIINTGGITYAPSFSTGYRAPNVDDAVKVFESVAGRLIIPNTNLKAEKTSSVELKIAKTINNTFKIQVIPYYTRLTNALSVAATTFNGQDSVVYLGQKSAVFTTKNLGKAEILGIFAGIEGIFAKHFNYAAAYNYTQGKVINENNKSPLDHIAPAFGRVSIGYDNNKLKASLFVLFNGAKKSKDYRLGTEDNEIYSADPVKGYMPSWWTLNLRAGYDLNKYLTLQAGIENILDKHYRVFASGTSGAGRNLSLTLRAKF